MPTVFQIHCLFRTGTFLLAVNMPSICPEKLALFRAAERGDSGKPGGGSLKVAGFETPLLKRAAANGCGGRPQR